MFLRAEGIAKSFDGQPVLRDVTFAVDKGDIASFIGPSGVGKTTLLKIIAGLEETDSGKLIFGTPPDKDNPVILVFQDYLLFPNLTVFDNVAFGLKARKIAKAETERRVMELLDFFNLADKRNDYPITLSAGQRQRVAIARAMVVNPAILLLDEPFANLDRNLKTSTAEFIRDTQKAFGVTTIAVTHDQEEAFLMSDHVGVMLEGQLAQFAPSRVVYEQPASLEVARFLGPVNELPADLSARIGLDSRLGYARPQDLHVAARPDGMGVLTDITFAGQYTKYTVDIDGTHITTHAANNGLSVGDRVDISANTTEEGE